MLIHIDTGAKIPELASQILRDALHDHFTKGFSFVTFYVDSAVQHFSDTVFVFLISHGLLVRLFAQVNWEFVVLAIYDSKWSLFGGALKGQVFRRWSLVRSMQLLLDIGVI